MNSNERAPTIDDIYEAADRLNGVAVRTQFVENEQLNSLTNARIFLKPENLQRTGSFKFRGAYNTISKMSNEERANGVVACSSGNHAQGVAMAASMFNVPATIVMPADAPQTKVDRTRRSGAEVILYDRATRDRDEVTFGVLKDKGGTFIHPFEHQDVIAGQGTVGLEISEDLQSMKIKPDRVVVCTGGGGLTAGVALSIRHHFPDAKVHPVEPEGFDDYKRSLISGKIEKNASLSGSICDAIISPSPGVAGFDINRDRLSEGLVVTDQEALNAVKYAFEELKLVVEPGGAVALAAILQAKDKWAGERVVGILSGGNIDAAMLSTALKG